MGSKKIRHKAKIESKQARGPVDRIRMRKYFVMASVLLILFLIPIAVSIATPYLENNSLSTHSYQTQRLQQPNLMKFDANVQVVNEPVTQQAATTTTDAITYYHNDHKGQPEYMTDESGNIVWRREQEPFGEETFQRGVPLTPYQVMAFNETHRMPGQEFDPEIALNINGARYYNPKTGRYTTPDPIGQAGGINPYVYAENNPVNVIDPEGLSSLKFEGQSNSLTLYDKCGKQITQCDAQNNVTRKSKGQWPAGTYKFSHYNPHPESDQNGAYGSNGIFVFNVPGRPGIGVHSGRANKGGPEAPTLGCIRTTDQCTKTIKDTHFGGDTLTDIEVK